jgi:DNA-binding NtrC family response regulator
MRGKALVVDNDSSIRRMVIKALEAIDFHCNEADGFSPAKQLICSDDYDILLVDKNMPGENGYEEGGMGLIRWVNQNKPNLAVIMMTGYATIDSALEALKLGAFDYLTKPFGLKDMLHKVERVCEYKKFINPQAYMSAYLDLTQDIMKFADGGSADITQCLTRVQERLKGLFQLFHSVERTLLEHRYRLAEIAVFVEQAKEELSADHPAFKLLDQIAEKASERL